MVPSSGCKAKELTSSSPFMSSDQKWQSINVQKKKSEFAWKKLGLDSFYLAIQGSRMRGAELQARVQIRNTVPPVGGLEPQARDGNPIEHSLANHLLSSLLKCFQNRNTHPQHWKVKRSNIRVGSGTNDSLICHLRIWNVFGVVFNFWLRYF